MNPHSSEDLRSLPPRPPALPAASPKRRFVKLGRRTSDGSQQSGTSSNSSSTVKSAEGAVIRQPSKSRIRNHNNRLSGVFLRGLSGPPSTSGSMASSLRSSLSIQNRKASTISTDALIAEDPSELSNHITAPGVLKIFGSEICEGAHYKSVLATTHSSARELVKEALERYGLNKEEAGSYVLCDTIGSLGDHQWKTEGFRIVGDNEKPLLLQSLWKPREGLARRFEIQKRVSVEEKASKEKDTVTAGINAQARKLQKSRSRVTSTLIERTTGQSKLWRSKSTMDMLDCDTDNNTEQDKSPKHQSLSPNSPQSYELPKTCPEQNHIEAQSEEDQRGSGARTEGLCQSRARGEREGAESEREETESSDDNTTQYSIHPPHDCPYLLLLQGHSTTQDFVIYLLASESIVVGQGSDHDQESKVDIPLFADDVLQRHCLFHRHQNGGATILCPCLDAFVTRNGELLRREVQLNPGDIIGLGQHYLFLFKDPASLTQQDLTKAEAETSLSAVPWLQAHTSPNEVFLCSTCLSACTDIHNHTTTTSPDRGTPFLKTHEGHSLTLTYGTEAADCIVKEIVSMGQNSSNTRDRPPLTVAFLLSMCIHYSSTSLQASDLRRLLLIIASNVQSTMWELTKDLAAIQPEVLETEDLQPLSLRAVIPGLRPLVVWMSNSLELLHFIQFQLPVLLEWRSRKEQGQEDGHEENEHNLVLQIHLSCVRSAVEETMAVLEEVIMLAFQQCVYYITKVLYPILPAVLDCNPFKESLDTPDTTDSSPVLEGPELQTPGEVQQVLEVLNDSWALLSDCQLNPEISSQLIAYLFYFINASLFNSLMERGSEAGFYQWSRGVHLRASLDLLLDWAHATGLGELALEQMHRLSSAINLLATPRKNLVKTSWVSLRSLYPALCPAQLHHLLSLYSPVSNSRRTWAPSVPDRAAAHQTADILESFDTHHPLVLPDGGYQIQLGSAVTDCGLREQLDQLKEFISTMSGSQSTRITTATEDYQAFPNAQSKALTQTTVHIHASPSPPSPGSTFYYDFTSCGAQLLSQKLQNLELRHKDEDEITKTVLDPSCLLTPPNTPHIVHHPLATTEQEEWMNNETNPWSSNEGGLVFECLAALKADRSSMKTLAELKEEEEEDETDYDNNDEVFSLELERGERGIGLALVDTRDTSLKVKGIFIRAVVPDSPAARSEKLAPGDRILAVNGVSLLGLDYQGGKELIQSSGDKVRLLVARSEWMTKALQTEH